MGKRENFAAFAANAGKTAKSLLNKAVQAADQTDDAVKIDAVLKGLKYVGNTTVASEVKNEARRYLEYDIEF